MHTVYKKTQNCALCGTHSDSRIKEISRSTQAEAVAMGLWHRHTNHNLARISQKNRPHTTIRYVYDMLFFCFFSRQLVV